MADKLSDPEVEASRARVKVTAEDGITPEEAAHARDQIAALAHYSGRPLENARLTLRVGGANRPARTFFVADASVEVNGRRRAAHATGPTPELAAQEASDRLRRQMRRVAGADAERRNERAVIAKAASAVGFEVRHRPRPGLKPAEQREIVTFLRVPSEPESTWGAIDDLIDHDYEFDLFRHVRTGEDVVVHRLDDGGFGLLHPAGSPLADENGVVVPEPSRYSEPIALVDARSEMDILGHRFLYFIDAEDQGGKVLYLRHDGDYGLVYME
jgi:ribosome-associated translation inhibitor RaiA